MKKNENVKNVYELAQDVWLYFSRSLTIFMCHFPVERTVEYC